MPRIYRIGDSCAVFALCHVSGVEEPAVIEVCKKHGFEWGRGMYDEEWKAAARELGIRLRAVSISPLKLRKFLHENPAGMFLVCTYNHVFSVNNGGIVVRPGTAPPGPRATIKQAWLVL